MSSSVIMEGKTVEHAVSAALSVLGVAENEVEVKVLEEGAPGVLGVFGAKQAKVEVMKKISGGEVARFYLQNVLDKMGLVTIVQIENETESNVELDVRGDDLGRVIGKEGQLITALQDLTSAAVSKRAKRRVMVSLDASGYRGRRERKLRKMAKEAAEKVVATGRAVILSPMAAGDRRLIHLALQNHPQVESMSEGRSITRRVAIRPKGKEPSKATP